MCIDVKQLTVDAEVADILCIGGSIVHRLKDGITGVANEFLFEHVCPHMRRQHPNNPHLRQNLGLAKSFAACDPALGESMPQLHCFGAHSN